eukprot:14056398-Alexandrium_andersonii.AAC.1
MCIRDSDGVPCLLKRRASAASRRSGGRFEGWLACAGYVMVVPCITRFRSSAFAGQALLSLPVGQGPDLGVASAQRILER